MRTPRGTLHVRSKLVGRPNVYNILAAVATAVALDLPFDAIERGIQRARRACPAASRSSRARRRSHGRRRLRAHRRRAAESARDRAPAGDGPADHGVRLRRRPRSHEAAADGRRRGAPERRRSSITSDNPRSEDPDRIIEEIQRGITPDTRRDSAQRLLIDRRSPRRRSRRRSSWPARRSRADRRQGAREVPGDRRPRAAVRRRRRRARGAGAAANELGRRVGRAVASAIRLTAAMGCRRHGRDARRAGDAEREFAGVSIDSRTLAPGELYIAIRGERFDGADFAADAVANGAAGVVVARGSRRRTPSGAVVTIVVEDTTVGAAGAGGGGSSGVGHESGGDHRQRGQDHDEGSDGGVSGGAVSRDAKPAGI